MELKYKISIIGSVIFAHFYALIERMIGEEAFEVFMGKFFSGFPVFRGVSAYHYVFMFFLFLLVGSLPLWESLIRNGRTRRVGIFLFGNRIKILWFVLGNILLIGLVEDAAYFYLYGEWIPPGYWTTNVIGYFQVGDFVIPSWYVLYVAIIIICYLIALKMDKIEARVKRYISR